MIHLMLLCSASSASSLQSCDSYTLDVRMTCIFGVGCTPKCKQGYFADSNQTCAYQGITDNQIPVCSAIDLKFEIVCTPSSVTVMESTLCNVIVSHPTVPLVTTTTLTDDFETSITFDSDYGLLISGFSVTSGIMPNVKISAATGNGSFTLESTIPRTFTVGIPAYDLLAIAASQPSNVTFTSGTPSQITLMSMSPTDFKAGDSVALTFSVLDKYSNVVTSAVGNLANVAASPETNVTWVTPPELDFVAGSAQVIISNTLSASLIAISIANGADVLSSNPTLGGPWYMSFEHATPSKVDLQVSAGLFVVGQSVKALLTLVDDFGNVATSVSNWRFALSVFGPSGKSALNGVLDRGMYTFHISWNYAEKLELLPIDSDSRGISMPEPVPVVFMAKATNVGLIVAVAVFVAASFAVVLFEFYRRRNIWMSADAKKQVFQTSEMIQAVIFDRVKPTEDPELPHLSGIRQKLIEAAIKVQNLQARLLSRVAGKYVVSGVGSNPPEDSNSAYSQLFDELDESKTELVELSAELTQKNRQNAASASHRVSGVEKAMQTAMIVKTLKDKQAPIIERFKSRTIEDLLKSSLLQLDIEKALFRNDPQPAEMADSLVRLTNIQAKLTALKLDSLG